MKRRLTTNILLFCVVFAVPMFFVSAQQNELISKTLKRGAAGQEVKRLQEFLGQLPGIYPEKLVTGYFGVKTEAAVKRLQKQHGIPQIGIAGPKTRKILNQLFVASLGGPPPPETPALPLATSPPYAQKPNMIPSCAVVNTESFFGCYYGDSNFSNLKVTRTDPKINFNWFDGTPDPTIPVDNFTVRWQGNFFFEADIYRFTIGTDDGMRLYIDDALVLDKWFDQPITIHSVEKTLTKGVHKITVDYYEHAIQAEAYLFWGKAEPPYFAYHWRASSTLLGDVEVHLPTPVPRPVVVLNGKPTVTIDTSAAVRLAQTYNIVLVNDDVSWDDLTAGMMYEMVRRLPDTRYKFGDNKPWQVSLTDKPLTNDIEITPYTKETAVRYAKVTRAAFARSNPMLQPAVDGNPERVFYSNRLFRAVLRVFFNERYLLEDILRERYGVKTGLGYPIHEFQDFNLEELQYLVTVFEDMPAGFRNIPGFEKVVRRKNGLTNPIHPSAPAIAWVDEGYVEFMDFAFTSGSEEYIRRLVAHEITHFLWHKILTAKTKEEFMKLSGWNEVSLPDLKAASLTVATDHPKATSRIVEKAWYRRTSTNFASDYAAAHNPDEDFAETVSYYIYQPDKVRTFAPDKYNFVKNVINGYEYVILVDQKYTFQVFNLEPHLTFPGKIVGVDISVTKLPSGDNEAIATLHLSPKYGGGAERAFGRLASPIGTYIDIGFDPVESNKYKLQSRFFINKSAAHGYWTPGQITVMDTIDNRRYEAQNQYGWLLFVNNQDEDIDPPVADLERITGELATVDGDQAVKIYVPLTDKNERHGLTGYATLQQYDSNQSSFNYAAYDGIGKRLIFTFPIRKYNASGEWTFRELWVADSAGNWQRYDLKEKALRYNIRTPSPDRIKPELDTSAIKIKAVPRHPEAPNGETDVTIWYAARDDNSGMGVVSYAILKPTGQVLFDYHYHDNFYTPYFIGASNEFKTYQIDLTLPPGSPPGTWVLQEIVIKDKAGNTLTSNFVEIGILRPFEVK